MARPPAIQIDTAVRVVLNVRSLNLTDDQFIRLCSDNRDLRIEMSAERELIIMPPPGSKTGQRNANVIYSRVRWKHNLAGSAVEGRISLPRAQGCRHIISLCCRVTRPSGRQVCSKGAVFACDAEAEEDNEVENRL